jgi:hypothetical protein
LTAPPHLQLSCTHLHIFVHDTLTMTDLTPTLNQLLSAKNGPSIPSASRPSPETADEFLKEAYRIVSTAAPPPNDKLTHPELTHPLPPEIPPINPPRLPNHNSLPTPQPAPHQRHQPTNIPLKPSIPPNRPRTRLHRFLNRPPPPRPRNLNLKPLFRRIAPPRNTVLHLAQEIRPLRRRPNPLPLGRRLRAQRRE